MIEENSRPEKRVANFNIQYNTIFYQKKERKKEKENVQTEKEEGKKNR